ncbi:hypothetical protein I5Q34_04990 [Streptomyces sp. AV19]|uniref:hypothetical protein n=1 Tax=Streptomyces sp. AV19 TaxID=2793068 RepID=UPI0018FEAB74|nr:hypothetical protein [Streptomyces sp. AV19]MBH1933655.1 hypothetical protein [Streptomyces sp. AV19]MDG4535838.1 hypothetical protein [Streptomyces sp. AV19]
MSGTRRVLVVLFAYVLAAAAVLAARLHLGDRIPDPMATHFTGSGADDFSGRGTFLPIAFGVLAGCAALFCVLTTLGRQTPTQQRGLAAAGCATAGLLGHALTAVLFANADAADVHAVRFPGWQLAVALGVAALTGGAGWLLCGKGAPGTGRRGPAGPAGPVEQLPLSEGESAAWTHDVGSRVLPLVGAGTLVLAVVLGLLDGPLPAIVLLVLGVPLTALTRARVTVDRRGVTVASSVVPRPRLTIPLERVVDASRRDVDAVREFGGWGYRAAAGASGLVLRSGEALSVRLTSGGEFVVTVDDAATGAALLNTLAARRAGG